MPRLIPLREFLDQTKGMRSGDIRAKFGNGYLLIDKPDVEDFGETEATVGEFQTIAGSDLLASIRADLEKAELVILAPPEEPPLILSVGRTRANPIRFNIAAISKFHAFLKYEALKEHFTLTDADSRNGTTINNNPLEANRAYDLHGNEDIVFGGRIHVVFHTALTLESILAILRGGARAR